MSPNASHYSASKGAMDSLARTMAAVWAQHNVRASAVISAPRTEMYDEMEARRTPDERARIDAWKKAAISSGGDLDGVDNVAPLPVCSTSDAGKFVTGQILPVMGFWPMSVRQDRSRFIIQYSLAVENE